MVKSILIKNISSRAARVAAAVGGIFLLLGFVYFFLAQTDTLEGYVPADAALYVHVQASLVGRSDQLRKSIEAIMPEVPVAAIDEASLVGRISGDVLHFGFVVRASSSFEKYLQSHAIAYHKKGNIYVIDPSGMAVVENGSGKFSLPFSLRYGVKNIFSVYGAKDVIQSYQSCVFGGAIHSLASSNGSLYAVGRVERGGILVTAPRQAKKAVGLRSYDDSNFDVILSTYQAQSLANIGATSQDLSVLYPEIISVRQFLQQLGAQKLVVGIKKNDKNTGWPLVDYSFIAKTYTPVDQKTVASLELAIKTAIANQFPYEKNVYLPDGTKIVELKRDPSQFSFSASTTYPSIQLPTTNTTIWYKNSTSSLVTTNDQGAIAPIFRGNYVYVKTSILPDRGWWQFFKNFTAIEITDRGFFIK